MTNRTAPKGIIASITLAVALFFAARASAQQAPPQIAVQPGTKIKASLKDASGKSWTIPAAKDKKVVIVTFWTADSTECTRQVSKLAKIVASRPDVQVLAVTRGRDKEERTRSEKAAKAAKWPFPVVYDTNLKVAKETFGVMRVPAFYIIDNASGRVVSAEAGKPDKKVRNFTFVQLVDRIRAGKPVPFVEGIAVDLTESGEARKLIGKKAPEFSFHDMRGNTRSLSAYDGKNLLLVFWSPGCPHCRRELPKLQSFYRIDAKKLNTEIVAIAGVSTMEEKAEGEAFVADAGLLFPVSFDMTRQMSADYGVQVVPTIVVVNRKGVVIEVLSGEMKDPAVILRSLLTDAAYMSGKPVK